MIPQARTSFLSENTGRLLEMLPPFEQGSVDVQAALDALAMELDRLDARVEEARLTAFPQYATTYLKLWEQPLGLAVEPVDKTLIQRQESVIAFVQSWATSASGLGWQAALTRLIGTGWNHEEHVVGDLGTPPEGVIRIGVPYTTELPAPTGLSATPGGVGTLGAGTYYYVVTAINFYGETTASAQVSATVGANGRVTLDWNNVSGATGYRVYRGTVNGGQKFRIASPTASDYIDSGASPGAEEPPSQNTTESFRAFEVRLLARQITPAHLELEFVYADAFILGVGQIGITPL